MTAITAAPQTLPQTLGLPGEWCLLAFGGEAWYVHAGRLEAVMVASGGYPLGDREIPGELATLAAGEGCYFPYASVEPAPFRVAQRWNGAGPISLIGPELALRAMAHLHEVGADPRLMIALAVSAGWAYPFGHTPEFLWDAPRSEFSAWTGELPPPLRYRGTTYHW